ncbi:MAG: ATP-binding protein [gamma proteobacterium symbiont of Bathyaustriella thionipta]|nr:ATP-binding protein [gamma proteobacterium symbiont of Bathyaustriella thionipta]MCU7951176.1 ATP-binding protein [gamma proteobacterium symbiont of Bathyaustriella thionipta]MCU7953987.1 ATP-binding protein [gamma proteobacterium symbiont of Bathyaustriella thionipta]MCU7957688.1 ATP-binding protein [gamma proteobacterium symbiont of Bathyaustriella thionipta]MCU7968782.1 ATP-binding protein [gamma proteobacterium symbiont of Bathyaustriella thionipta]
MQFYADKESRLNELDYGNIHISVSNKPTDTGGNLTIVFEDSGKGFDVQKRTQQMPQIDENNPLIFSGRGISLIENYCSTVTYNESGNRVECVYSWSND